MSTSAGLILTLVSAEERKIPCVCVPPCLKLTKSQSRVSSLCSLSFYKPFLKHFLSNVPTFSMFCFVFMTHPVLFAMGPLLACKIHRHDTTTDDLRGCSLSVLCIAFHSHSEILLRAHNKWTKSEKMHCRGMVWSQLFFVFLFFFLSLPFEAEVLILKIWNNDEAKMFIVPNFTCTDST